MHRAAETRKQLVVEIETNMRLDYKKLKGMQI